MTPEDHSGGPVHCEQLGPFVDGELGAVEAAGFRRHLVQCARCQQEMHGLMQLSALAEGAREQVRPASPSARRFRIAAADRRVRPRRAAWMGVVGAVAMAAALVLALRGAARRAGSAHAARLARCADRLGLAERGRLRAVQAVCRRCEVGPCPVAPRARPGRAPAPGEPVTGGPRPRWPCSDATSPRRRRISRGLPPTPDVLADRGLVRLEEQRYPEALEYLDSALTTAPDFLPARFNRALALQALQLPFAAAAAMGPVAQSAVGGWATEARQDAATFESAKSDLRADDARWKEARRALIERQEPPDAALVSTHRSLARAALYHALASAGTRADIERLRPFARELGREIGSDFLESRIDTVLRGWTPARADLADRYRGLIIDLSVPPPDVLDGLLAASRGAGQSDILQMLYEGYRPYAVGPERESLVRMFQDPWFQASLAARIANAEMDTGRVLEAERRIRQGRELCRPQSMEIPCWFLTETLGDLYRMVGRFADAQREYRTVAPRLKAAGMFPFERKAMLEAARVAVQADQLALARASYEDLSLREPERCLTWVWSRELLASGYVGRQDPENARKVLSVRGRVHREARRRALARAVAAGAWASSPATVRCWKRPGRWLPRRWGSPGPRRGRSPRRG